MGVVREDGVKRVGDPGRGDLKPLEGSGCRISEIERNLGGMGELGWGLVGRSSEALRRSVESGSEI